MKKVAKVSLITLGIVLLLFLFLLLTPLLFTDRFGEIVKNTAQEKLKTELAFGDLDVSFFKHFPYLTISLSDFSLRSSAPFENDTLVSAREIAFGVNLRSVFKGPLLISRVFIDEGKVLIAYNEQGSGNYDVYITGDTTAQEPADTTASIADLKIENISFVRTTFIYRDPTVPVSVVARGIHYKGKSDLSDNIFSLLSKIEIDSVDITYNHIPYIKSKPVKARLSTKVNLQSLELNLEKNDLFIKDIPFSFNGKFTFRKEGYELVMKLRSDFAKESFSTSLKLISTDRLWIFARARFDIDMEKWSKGFGITSADLRGRLNFDLVASGTYALGQNPKSNRPDTVIVSVPEFSFGASVRNGYFKYRSLPEAISGINLDLNASLEGNDYRNIRVSLDQLSATLMKNRISGHARVTGVDPVKVDAGVATSINLGEIGKAIPMDSLELSGRLDLEAKVAGTFDPGAGSFPASKVTLKLSGGSVQTRYYPHPVEQINLDARLTNNSGALSDTRGVVDPLTFNFEGNPFTIKAFFENPRNLIYDVTADGTLEIGKIYKVFAVEGVSVDGLIRTHLKLKGRQEDVLAGRYGKLENSGTLEMQHLSFGFKDLPHKFNLSSGLFRFDRDKLWFERFKGRYGSSDLTLDGHLNNVLNYFFDKKAILHGSFTLRSAFLDLDEFMAPVEPAPAKASGTDASASAPVREAGQPESGSGVIVVPANLDLSLQAGMDKIRFRKLDLKDFSAMVQVKNGLLALKGAKVEVVGCKAGMDLIYGSYSPDRAHFDFHVTAADFDVKRAYNEVELFRNLSTAAGKCEGIISLDYTLKGILKSGMEPVYPSLEGGGTITLKKVKVMGLKLFTAMSSNLEREKLKSPDLSKVEIKTTIKNNVITLERTKLKIAGFRLRMEGESNFDGAIRFKTRLGLPPLGIFGIPIRILGTMDQPKFKYGRGNQDEEVEETNFTDELPPDMLDKIRNAREDPE